MAESAVETNEAVSGTATAGELVFAQSYAPVNCKQNRSADYQTAAPIGDRDPNGLLEVTVNDRSRI